MNATATALISIAAILISTYVAMQPTEAEIDCGKRGGVWVGGSCAAILK